MVRQYSATNRRSSSAHSGSLNRSRTPRMDVNHLNSNNINPISTNETTKSDDFKMEINEKPDDTVVTMLPNDLLASPNFLRIPLKPIEKPTNQDDPTIEKP